MHQRTRQRGLQALALRVALGAAARAVGEIEQHDQFIGAATTLDAAETMQFAEVDDVLGTGEVRIEAGGM